MLHPATFEKYVMLPSRPRPRRVRRSRAAAGDAEVSIRRADPSQPTRGVVELHATRAGPVRQ